ncbi:MAG: class I SAM-dependent methyltransferase [Planctomycetota bacterium]|jgi:ubiquinone/menaquinone biosynthesis C-methylase UbiE
MLLDEDLGLQTKCSHRWRYGWLGLLGLLAVSLSVLTLRPMQVAKADPVEPATGRESAAEDQPGGNRQEDFKGKACKVLADKRVEEPTRAIVEEYGRRSGLQVLLEFLPAAEVDALVEEKEAGWDVVLCMPKDKKGETPVGSLPGAKKVAWKHPSGEPVWAAVLSKHPKAAGFVRFVGGPTGHRLWSESKAGFTITTGKTHAEAFEWVVENRVKHTYPLTAMRMLGEIGGIRDGICIDIGCGTGNLDVELAKRSNFTIIGLDIDPDMKPLFEKRVHEAGLKDRFRFVTGDAQKLPFSDDYADVIVSRGTLTFIPDIGKCLREVDRVLKPTGVAFLGGRYIYTPQSYKISNEKLKKIVSESGVPGAKLVEHRGQWVKIIGPDAPKAAHQFQAGPHMLANRFIADYAITKGKCLLICMNDGGGAQGLQQGFLEITQLQITALYPSEKVAGAAEKRIREAKLTQRITCKVGTLDTLPFEEASFDLIAGAGPMLIWGERQKKMREIYRVLRPGGVAFIGGRYLGMPDFRKVSSEDLRASAAKTGIPAIRVVDDGGQWVEIRKGVQERGLRN